MPLMLQRSQMEGLESMVGFSARFIAAQAIPSTIEGISAYFRSLEEEETKRQAIAANRDVLVSRINAERDVILVLQRRFLNLVSFGAEIASRKARPQSCQARGQVVTVQS